jgi:hypothetical protein
MGHACGSFPGEGMNSKKSTDHSASAAALGFYYQAFYALHALLTQSHDDATVCLERLDDVEIHVNGQSLLSQLKHSMSKTPPAITMSSKALWRTLKAWIDILPRVVLNETMFQLVTVAPFGKDGVLQALLDNSASREPLHDALTKEAERLVSEFKSAKDAKTSPLPHTELLPGCQAFLDLDLTLRLSLLNRISITTGNANIIDLEEDIANSLTLFLPENRAAISKRLIGWWDLQVIYTLANCRDKFISRVEVLKEISQIAADLERDELASDFDTSEPPLDHEPDSMLARQIDLVKGRRSDYAVARREQWRAHAQRELWSSSRLDMAARLTKYDYILQEAWKDKHGRMVEDCESLGDNEKCEAGKALLRWSTDDAHKEVQPLARNWNAPYYVRGSYQTLAIELRVGWHPEFDKLLGNQSI